MSYRISLPNATELKHKYFTNIASKTQNFVNITKTMANAHQLDICFNQFSIPEVKPSKLSKGKLIAHPDFQIYVTSSNNYFSNQIDSVYIVEFFEYNSVRYSKGLMIIHDESIYEIVLTLQFGSSYSLLCKKYKILRFSHECNGAGEKFHY